MGVGMVSSGSPGLSAAALAALSLFALASVATADDSCFKEFAIAKLYKTKYEVCNGDNSIQSDFFEIMNVSLSAPYDRRVGKHVLWRNHQVQICLTAKATTLTKEVAFMQNAAFGYVHFPLIPITSPFCDVDKNPCTNMKPACKPGSATLVPGQEFCSCSNIAVPGAALPGLDVDVSWILMSTENEPKKSDCEVQRGTEQLAGKGKKKVVCIKIPTVIRNKPNRKKTK